MRDVLVLVAHHLDGEILKKYYQYLLAELI